MLERVFAAIVLAACLALLLRLSIGAPRRARIDAALHRAWRTLQHRLRSIGRERRSRRDAAKAAAELIARARGRGDWDGNVYTPKSFRKPRRDKMH